MSEQQDDDVGRSFDRLNHSQEYREAKDGLGATRQGLHARRTYWPRLAKEIGDNRAGSRDKALWRALKGIGIDDLAKTLVNVGLNVCASDRLGIDRKTGNKTYIDTAETIARNLVQCRDRKLRIKVGDWAIERLRTLPIFENLGRFRRTSGSVLYPVSPADLDDFVLDIPMIPAQTARDFLYWEAAHEHVAQLGNLRIGPFPDCVRPRPLVLISAPCGSRIEVPIRRRRASCSGFRGPLRNAPTSISVTWPPDQAFAWCLTKAEPVTGSRARNQLSPLGLR